LVKWYNHERKHRRVAEQLVGELHPARHEDKFMITMVFSKPGPSKDPTRKRWREECHGRWAHSETWFKKKIQKRSKKDIVYTQGLPGSFDHHAV